MQGMRHQPLQSVEHAENIGVTILGNWLHHAPRVLLAEDDDDLRQALASVLLIDGFEVFAVRNGFELLEKIADCVDDRGAAPDVIVTDVRMPGFNALNIVAGLRDIGVRTPIIIMSAFGDDVLRARIQGLPDTAFFAKPIDIGAFERAVLRAASALDGAW